MAYELFASASSKTSLIFCDANFLYDLALQRSSVLQRHMGSGPGHIQRARDASAFYQRYRSNKTEFISSPYALEEIANKVTQQVLKQSHENSWKQLRDRNPREFANLRAVALAILNELWTQLRTYDMEYAVPRLGSGNRKRTVVHQDVVEAALIFYRAYDVLDMMDAFHVATALACGANWVATSDKAFQNVSEINVFSGV